MAAATAPGRAGRSAWRRSGRAWAPQVCCSQHERCCSAAVSRDQSLGLEMAHRRLLIAGLVRSLCSCLARCSASNNTRLLPCRLTPAGRRGAVTRVHQPTYSALDKPCSCAGEYLRGKAAQAKRVARAPEQSLPGKQEAPVVSQVRVVTGHGLFALIAAVPLPACA